MLQTRKKQKGQALVETALTLPLLIMMLLGVGYFGSAITAMHNLNVAARYSAREVAMDSTSEPLYRTNGVYFALLTSSKIKEFAMKSLPGFSADRLEVTPLDASQIATLTASVSQGKLLPIAESKGYAFVYRLTGKANAVSTTISGKSVAQLRGYDVGIGNIFFAVKLKYHLKEIDWLSKYLFLKEGLKIEAVSVMPAELPLRSSVGLGINYGLIGMNKGLFDIMTFDVRKSNILGANEYENLVPED